MVLNIDVAPTILDLADVEDAVEMQGYPVSALARGESNGWRSSWLYQYNFEEEFPYTPNVRAVRTDDWKYIHYPNGPGRPDTETAKVYNLANDQKEQRNLIADRLAGKALRAEGRAQAAAAGRGCAA